MNPDDILYEPIFPILILNDDDDGSVKQDESQVAEDVNIAVQEYERAMEFMRQYQDAVDLLRQSQMMQMQASRQQALNSQQNLYANAQGYLNPYLNTCNNSQGLSSSSSLGSLASSLGNNQGFLHGQPLVGIVRGLCSG